MLDLCCMLADDDRNDIRIEAALVKLYGSEMAWQMADELMQIRGGRGYETADSLAARGEKAIGVEQLLRDLRINRIFEGSTEIMHLLIAREAVDQHLSVAGDIIDPDADLGRKAKAGAARRRVLRPLAADARGRQGSDPRWVRASTARWPQHVRFVERASRRLARETFYGMARWRGKMERKQAFLGRIVDIGAELFAMSAACVRATAERPAGGPELADLFCRQARLRVEALFDELWRQHRLPTTWLARKVTDGRYAFVEEGVVPPPTDGEWVAPWEPGESDRRGRTAADPASLEQARGRRSG